MKLVKTIAKRFAVSDISDTRPNQIQTGWSSAASLSLDKVLITFTREVLLLHFGRLLFFFFILHNPRMWWDTYVNVTWGFAAETVQWSNVNVTVWKTARSAEQHTRAASTPSTSSSSTDENTHNYVKMRGFSKLPRKRSLKLVTVLNDR